MSFWTQSNQVFFGHPLCLIPSTSHVIQCLTSHYHLFVQQLQTTSFSSSNWLVPFSEFFTFLRLIQLNPHIHLIILISVRFIFNSCSTFICQVSLPCIRQLLTQVAYTLPFSFTENPFTVRMRRYSRNFFQADMTSCYCWITSSICTQITEFIYLFQRYQTFQPYFQFTLLSHRLSSLSAIKIKSSAYSNSRGKPACSSLEIISVTITNSRGLKTDSWCNSTFTSNALLSPSVVLSTTFSNLQKQSRASFLYTHISLASATLWTVKIASVVRFPGINPNCIASIFTFSLILLSNTRSITFITYSSNFFAL